MIFERIASEGLAHYSYVFGDEQAGLCAVIDPRRDVDIYLELAERHKARITHILETHIHADFVSGSCELADRTGAPIGVGATGEYGFEHQPLQDGEHIELGEFKLKALHTPGHTPEHISFLISGGAGAKAPWGVFSGDTLFAGEVGRPDLLGDDQEEALARRLHHTLQQVVLPLGDEIVIYPAHGEGSPCGANIGARKSSTIGYERKQNRLLQLADVEQFVEAVLAQLEPAPSYYPRMKRINAEGPILLGQRPFLPPLPAEQFAAEREQPDTIVLDTRSIEAFAGAHIPGALNIGLREPFPIWAGRILDETLPNWAGQILHPDNRILLVAVDAGAAEEARTGLARVGYEKVVGYLRKDIHDWTEKGKKVAHLGLLSVHELKTRLDEKDNLQVVDVRSQKEWEEGHVPGATHIHVPDLEEEADTLDREQPVVTYCGSGYRASIAASILKREGFAHVYNVPGSISAWQAAGYPTVKPELENSDSNHGKK